MKTKRGRFHRMVHFLVSRLPIPFKSKAGEISEEPSWVIINDGYLYIADTLRSVILVAMTEWKDDKHLVG